MVGVVRRGNTLCSTIFCEATSFLFVKQQKGFEDCTGRLHLHHMGNKNIGSWRSYRSWKRKEFLGEGILRYALKNDVKKDSSALTVTVTVTKFRKFQMATPTFFLFKCHIHMEKLQI
ncbi:hypothetical protein AVEN_235143-1 [Araneus ventricosus]|uniref:Uncharacterized protein n=1 Tax=Araneus ventricosus TaxID=182803 RepID=A0A4Y2SR61_ARAVE|nr:hypothetical protein AVEN_235143-1 [Araneus ventricosus]